VTSGLFRLSRARIAILVCLLVAGYFLYSASFDAFQSHKVANEQQQEQRELVRLQEKQAYLEAVKSYAASDQYVEQEARRQLGYIREGEVPFVVTSPPATEGQVHGEWWERLFPR
jgi:cell division protein FtsB